MSNNKVYSREEVAKHNQTGDAWLIVNGDVYDVSKFAAMHPGSEVVLRPYFGKDATEPFYALHRHEVIVKYQPRLRIGKVEGAENEEQVLALGEISPVPYAEAPFWRGFKSPYFNASHDAFRRDLRMFLQKEVKDIAEASEIAGTPPTDEMFAKLGNFGVLASRIVPGPHLKWFNRLPGDVKPDQFDYFHEMIAHEEVARIGCPGFVDGIGSGMVIGLPPVMQFGPDWMKKKVGQDVLFGRKRICLAITEPTAGSDVANISTTAVLNAAGTHYVVNGVKKWITGGCESQYFTTAVRTGGDGMGGISLLLIERSEGLETARIKTAYSTAAGTAYVTYDNVLVPRENLIGKENQGFMYIMYNFNHERWLIVCYIVALTRGVIEECWKWANQRQAFGKPLFSQPVIRFKLAQMAAQTEAVSSWLENLTYQMVNHVKPDVIGASIALCKFQATRVAQYVSDEAVQIFGGRGITAGGMGKNIERFMRTNKFAAILGGSEEVMADLGARMSQRTFPKNAKL